MSPEATTLTQQKKEEKKYILPFFSGESSGGGDIFYDELKESNCIYGLLLFFFTYFCVVFGKIVMHAITKLSQEYDITQLIL